MHGGAHHKSDRANRGELNQEGVAISVGSRPGNGPEECEEDSYPLVGCQALGDLSLTLWDGVRQALGWTVIWIVSVSWESDLETVRCQPVLKIHSM